MHFWGKNKVFYRFFTLKKWFFIRHFERRVFPLRHFVPLHHSVPLRYFAPLRHSVPLRYFAPLRYSAPLRHFVLLRHSERSEESQHQNKDSSPTAQNDAV